MIPDHNKCVLEKGFGCFMHYHELRDALAVGKYVGEGISECGSKLSHNQRSTQRAYPILCEDSIESK